MKFRVKKKCGDCEYLNYTSTMGRSCELGAVLVNRSRLLSAMPRCPIECRDKRQSAYNQPLDSDGKKPPQVS